jgi:hypothetical protein
MDHWWPDAKWTDGDPGSDSDSEASAQGPIDPEFDRATFLGEIAFRVDAWTISSSGSDEGHPMRASRLVAHCMREGLPDLLRTKIIRARRRGEQLKHLVEREMRVNHEESYRAEEILLRRCVCVCVCVCVYVGFRVCLMACRCDPPSPKQNNFHFLSHVTPKLLLYNPSYLIHLFSGYQQHYLTTYLAPLNAPTVTQSAVWLQYLKAAAAGLALLGLGLGCVAYAVTSGSIIGSLASAHWLSAVLVTLLLDLLFMQVKEMSKHTKTQKLYFCNYQYHSHSHSLSFSLCSHATCSSGP